MRTVARDSALKLSASLGLLVLAAWAAQPARAADQQVAALSRPCVAAAGSVCASDVARSHAAAPVGVKAAAKPAAVQPAAVKPSRTTNYERDLWRHQGVG